MAIGLIIEFSFELQPFFFQPLDLLLVSGLEVRHDVVRGLDLNGESV